MSKVWFSVVLGTAALFGLPGVSSAQHGGRFRPGNIHHNMDRRFFDRRFDRFDRDFDRRFDFDQRFDFDRRFFDPRFGRFGPDLDRRFDFDRRFFDHRFSPRGF